MASLRTAIDICPYGDLADPRAIVRLARAAEESGWDGVSIWDGLGLAMGTVSADPFVALTAVAGATSRLRLITSVVALARRRPQLVVQAAASLDLVSEGRLVLGLGAGEDEPDFTAFDDPYDRAVRIARMDEALAIVDAGLRGERLAHAGPLLRAEGVTLGPRPLQQPRPPIWLGAMRPGGIRRAARWEGWIVVGLSVLDTFSMSLSAAELETRATVLTEERATLGRAREPFDIAVLGMASLAGDLAAWESAGVTWWLESLSPVRGPLAELEAVVRAGPPR